MLLYVMLKVILFVYVVYFSLLNEHDYLISILENLYSLQEKNNLFCTLIYSTFKAEKEQKLSQQFTLVSLLFIAVVSKMNLCSHI